MQAADQHVGPILERMLRAVAVVDVPIDDQDPFQAVGGQQVGGS